MPAPILPPIGPDLRQWARQFTQYFSKNAAKIYHKSSDDNPSDDGVLLWDEVNEWPVVSYDNEFRQIVIEGGHAKFIRTANQTAASADTAYSITYDAPTNKYKIDRDASNNERIVFEEKGEYLLNFTAEITSSSASDVKFYFWPAKNGTNLDNLTVIKTIHNNGGVLTASRSFLLELDANDYIEMKWAVNSTNGSLSSSAATAFAPASPASTLAITRTHA